MKPSEVPATKRKLAVIDIDEVYLYAIPLHKSMDDCSAEEIIELEWEPDWPRRMSHMNLKSQGFSVAYT